MSLHTGLLPYLFVILGLVRRKPSMIQEFPPLKLHTIHLEALAMANLCVGSMDPLRALCSQIRKRKYAISQKVHVR